MGLCRSGTGPIIIIIIYGTKYPMPSILVRRPLVLTILKMQASAISKEAHGKRTP